MFQIDVSTAASTQPAATAAGTPGFFTDGNPATATAATVVPAEWLNAVMLEISNVITAAGLSLSKPTYNQLTLAINTLIGNSRPTFWSGTDTGAANAYTATLSPVPAAYTGMVLTLKAVNANTGASTGNFNALGVRSIKKMSGGSLVALASGDMPAGGIAILAYDGTQFILLNPPAAGIILADNSLRNISGLQVNEAITSIAVNTTLTANTHHLANIVATTAIYLTLPKASTAGMMAFAVLAQGGAVWIVPNAADAIQGGSVGVNFYLPKGSSAFVITDGAASGNWWLFNAASAPWTANVWSMQQTGALAGLVDVPTVAWDLSNSQVAQITLSASRTLAAPTNQVNGTYYSLRITQGGGGGFAVAFNAAYKGVSGLVLSTAPGAVDHLVFRSTGAAMELVALRQNVGA